MKVRASVRRMCDKCKIVLMILYKMPEEVYQEIMAEMHHYAPMDEQEKIKVQQDQLLNAKDSNGKRLGQIEGDGMQFDQSRQAPVF